MIKALLYKDLKQGLEVFNRYKLLFIVNGLIFIMSVLMGELVLAFLTLNIFLYSIILETLELDENSGSITYLSTLVNKNKIIVRSKYIQIFGATLISIILNSFLHIVVKNYFNHFNNFKTLLFLQFTLMGFFSVYLPIVLKSGTKKGLINIFIVEGILIVLLIAILYLIIKIYPEFMSNKFVVNSFVLILFSLVVGISYIVSIKILENKEY